MFSAFLSSPVRCIVIVAYLPFLPCFHIHLFPPISLFHSSTVHFNLYFNQHLTTSNYLSLYYTIQYNSQIAAHFPYLIMLFMLFPLFSGRRVCAFVRSLIHLCVCVLMLFSCCWISAIFPLLAWANINGESNSVNGSVAWAYNSLPLNMQAYENLFTSTFILFICSLLLCSSTSFASALSSALVFP